jgi:hypothetical protein
VHLDDTTISREYSMETMTHALNRTEGEVDDGPATGPGAHVNFGAPATLRKWPSLNNQRRAESPGPYLLLDGTLDQCIREFMAKPAPVGHLYEIHTAPQPPLVSDILSGEIVAELARLRDFSLASA